MAHQRGTPRVPRRGRTARALFAGLLMLAGVGGVLPAASQLQKGIDLRVSPAAQAVPRGGQATYTVSLSSRGGFTGAVGLSVSGLPSGSSARFAPASVQVRSGKPAVAVTMTVTVGAGTPIGTRTLTVNATSGKVKDTVRAGLTVLYPLSSSLSMTAAPATVTLAPGSVATYLARLVRANLPGPVSFTVTGLPAGARATFAPNPTWSDFAALQVATGNGTPGGRYSLKIVATGKDTVGVTRTASATVELVVEKGLPFTISGSVTGLAPGVSQPLNLTLSNPNKKPLSVTNLGVSITQVTRAAGATLPCGTADYAVTQYAGGYPLIIPANGTVSLAGLGVPSPARPQVTMLDRPLNQDGCKGARLTLAYTGAGYGG